MIEPELYSPRQLPDIDGQEMVFQWDQEEADSIISYGDRLVWRERTGWEVFERFAEIAEVLQYKYGNRLKDLVPTERSKYALLGDRYSAYFVVERARGSLGSQPEVKSYALRELAEAIKSNNVEAIRKYLAQGGNASESELSTGISLLHLATQCRHSLIVKMLLNAGAKVNVIDFNGHSPLFEALEMPITAGGGVVAGGFQMPGPSRYPAPRIESSYEIVRLLVDAGANLDGLDRPLESLRGWPATMYKPPLALAARYGHIKTLRFLLERGADPNQKDYGNMTALHHAVFYGNVEATSILVSAGADLDATYAECAYTPLICLINSPDNKAVKADLIRLLVEKGADINKTNSTGESPLFSAINNVHNDLVQLLIDLGANIHHRDHQGNGALLFLVLRTRMRQLKQAEMLPIIKTLLAAGVDPAVRNNDGKTARELAHEFKFKKLEELL